MSSTFRWSILYIFSWTFVAISGSLWLSDPDIFWHLKVGEWIVENMAVPRTDIYSWSVYGEPWTAHQWLWEALLYSVHKYTGLIGIWVLTFIMGFISGLLIRSGLKLRGVTEGVATAAGGLGVLLLMGWLKPWPQAGMYALFSAYLFLSLRNRWGWREILYVAGIGMLWGNIHSTALMLPLLLLAEVFWKLIFKRHNNKEIGWRLGAVVSSGIATLFNPHGYNLWAYVIDQGLLTNQYRENIYSWMPYHFGFNSLSLMFFMSIIILFISVRQGKEKELEFLRAAGFWVLALMSRIYTPFAVLSTATLFGTLKIDLGVSSIKRLTVLSFLAGLLVINMHGIPSDLEEVAKEDGYPVAALEYIKEEGYEKIFNDHGWGGYLLWKGTTVYIDGRNDVYRDLIDDYINISKLEKPVGHSIKETGAETVLTRVSGMVDLALKESEWWEMVYRDEVAVVYRIK